MIPVYHVETLKKTFRVRLLDDNRVEVDEKVYSYYIEKLNDDTLVLNVDGTPFCVVDLSTGNAKSDQSSSTVTLSVNGREFTVSVDDEQSLRLKSYLTARQHQTGLFVLRAPMPGLVTRIEVKEGQQVVEGEGLLILEAMKMENEVCSSYKGVVRQIHVAPKTPVEKGAPLVTIEY